MGNTCCCRAKKQKKICLLLLGLDNAGKTVAAKNLAGEPLDEVVPTIGFSVIDLLTNGYKVKVYDLGGGPNIRGIWHRYFVDAYGLIFVVDSSDYSRLTEVKEVLHSLLSHEKISGKPVLILANKQDNENALDELDLIETLQLEELVNKHKCPTLVESCSATNSNKQSMDPGIRKGYNWLLHCIIRDYKNLNRRVSEDVEEQEIEVQENRRAIINRLRQTQETQKRDDDIIELYSEYSNKLNGFANNSSEAQLEIVNDTNAIVERPKSATQAIKEQLEMQNVKRRVPLRLRRNRTQPVNLYGTKMSRSAQQHRTTVCTERGALHSAGDSVFVVSNAKRDLSRNIGDGDCSSQLFEMRSVAVLKHSNGRDHRIGEGGMNVVEID